MAKLHESDIEQFTIDLLQSLNYQYFYGPDISPNGDTLSLTLSQSEREKELVSEFLAKKASLPLGETEERVSIFRYSYEDVLLLDRLRKAVERINPTIPEEARKDAIKQIQRLNLPDLIANNETFHRMLTEGIKVTYQKHGEERGDLVWLIDFKNPENNDFLVVNQFTIVSNSIKGHTYTKRPDVVLFINGLPLVVMELKNPADENATVKTAYNQIQDRFMAWKSVDGRTEASNLTSQLETLIKGMLNKETLLDLIRHFIVFDKSKKEDKQTGQITIHTDKKLAAYHQYYAVNKAVESAIKAAKSGTRKAGVIWHTQGSGKSLSMVFFAGKIVLSLENPTVLVITDRNDLDDQLFDTFAASKQILRQEPVQAESREDLKKLLKVASGGIVFTTIQKFYPEEGNVYDKLSDRGNIIVIADEAHRTQYGFKAKIDKETGDIKYGFAKYIRDALPNATYIGFTGTPIEKTDRNTPAVFGNYIDIYDISRAVEDGMTVPIYYESRLAKITLSEEGKKLVAELDEELKKDEFVETQKVKRKWTQLEALVGSKERLEKIAKDIVEHFKQRQEVFEGKGMIVTMSRRIAALLYDEIIKLKPEWHSDDLKKGRIKVVITPSSSDEPFLTKHHTTKDQRRMLADRMKDPEDELKLVIVCDMWLTGFDVPCLTTMYIDKPMKGHTLMQAIARVNRVYKDKPGGLIVDYLGIAADLKKALSFYSESGGKGDPALTQEQAVGLIIKNIFQWILKTN